MNGNNIFGRIVAGLVLIAVVLGVAFFAFNAGMAQGVATKVPQSVTQPGTVPYAFYGAPFFWHPFFGIFGFIIGLLVLFFVFRLISFIVFGPRWGWGGHWHRHAWRHGWYDGEIPPMVKEMHDRLHGNTESGNKEQ